MAKQAAAAAATPASVKGASATTTVGGRAEARTTNGEGAAPAVATATAVETAGGLPAEAGTPNGNGNGARGSKPGNISVAQLAMSMFQKRAAAISAAPIASTADALEQATDATEEEGAEEQAAVSDDGANDVLDDGVSADAADGGEESRTTTRDEDEDEAGQLPKGIRELQARVGKLTARAKAAEERAAAAEARASALPQGERDQRDQSLVTSTATTGGTHPHLAAIDQELAVAREALLFAQANPDGGEYTEPSGRKKFFSAEQVALMRFNAEELRQDARARRAVVASDLQKAVAQQRAGFQAELRQAYPWTAKRAEELTEAEAGLVQEYRETLAVAGQRLRDFPDAEVWIADAVAGRRARLAQAATRQQQQAGNANRLKVLADGHRLQTRREPPRVVTQATAGTPRVNGQQRAVAEATDRFKASGNTKALAGLLSARRAARLAPG